MVAVVAVDFVWLSTFFSGIPSSNSKFIHKYTPNWNEVQTTDTTNAEQKWTFWNYCQVPLIFSFSNKRGSRKKCFYDFYCVAGWSSWDTFHDFTWFYSTLEANEHNDRKNIIAFLYYFILWERRCRKENRMPLRSVWWIVMVQWSDTQCVSVQYDFSFFIYACDKKRAKVSHFSAREIKH